MSRADLHSALVLDHEIYLRQPRGARAHGPDGADRWRHPRWRAPDHGAACRTRGRRASTPSTSSSPIATAREVARSPLQRIRLSGEAFEDSFDHGASTDIYLRTGDGAHRALLRGRRGGRLRSPCSSNRARAETRASRRRRPSPRPCRRASVIWLTVPQPAPRGREPESQQKVAHHTQPVWFVFEGGKLYVLNGPDRAAGAQPRQRQRGQHHRAVQGPALEGVRRPSNRARPSRPRTTAGRRSPAAGLGKRLNLPDGDAALERWREHCTLYELTPQLP
jgi:hypothetical protein